MKLPKYVKQYLKTMSDCHIKATEAEKSFEDWILGNIDEDFNGVKIWNT